MGVACSCAVNLKATASRKRASAWCRALVALTRRYTAAATMTSVAASTDAQYARPFPQHRRMYRRLAGECFGGFLALAAAGSCVSCRSRANCADASHFPDSRQITDGSQGLRLPLEGLRNRSPTCQLVDAYGTGAATRNLG